MKQLNFYKKNSLNNVQEVFSYFMETMISTNRTWEYFINWDKVFNGADKYRNELMKLNSLCGSLFPGEELKSLLKKNPNIICSNGIINCYKFLKIKFEDLKKSNKYLK